jgi:hypothetical protein
VLSLPSDEELQVYIFNDYKIKRMYKSYQVIYQFNFIKPTGDPIPIINPIGEPIPLINTTGDPIPFINPTGDPLKSI